jgi:hypothetical protein
MPSSFADFARNAVIWRITGGQANGLKMLGILPSDANGNVAVSDAAFPARTSGTNNSAVGKGALKNSLQARTSLLLAKTLVPMQWST